MVEPPHLDELTRIECFELLERCTVGRVAVTDLGRSPMVVPVRYAMEDETIVFRSLPGAKLEALLRHPCSFEIDDVDHAHHSGWSVLVRGSAMLADDVEVELEHWVTDGDAVFVRLIPAFVTGRRVVPETLTLDSRGYL